MGCLSHRLSLSPTITPRGVAGWATVALLLLAAAGHGAVAADNAAMEQKVLSVVLAVEDYIAANMKAFDVPGLAIGIVVGDNVARSSQQGR
jgi:hypothetical protein